MRCHKRGSDVDEGKKFYHRCGFKLNVDEDVLKIKIEDLRHKEARWLFLALGFALFLFCVWLVLSFTANSFILLSLALVLTLIGDIGGVYYSQKIEKLMKEGYDPKHGGYVRRIIEFRGKEYTYSVHLLRGFLISLGVGFISSIFGVGSGIIHVPAMILYIFTKSWVRKN